MTTQELHIELDILLQKINSSWNKNFLPQEYDLLLNREINKFIKQRVNPLSNDKRQSAFDIIQRVQNLNPLIKTRELDLININQEEVTVLLPLDFLGYISSEVGVKYNCDTVVSQSLINNNVYTFKPIKSSNIEITDLIEVEISLTYLNKAQEYTSVTLFKLSELPIVYLPQDNIDDYLKYFIYDNAINKVVKKNLIEVNNDSLVPIEFTYDNVTSLFQFRSTSPITLEYEINETIQTLSVSTFQSFNNTHQEGFNAPLGIMDEEFKSFIKGSTLSGSTVENIKGILREKELYIYTPKGASLRGLTLTYICKPIQIDLLLGIDSELPDSVLTEIVSNTAQSLKGIISSDTYEKFTRENTLIE